jgi:hypothetical protein
MLYLYQSKSPDTVTLGTVDPVRSPSLPPKLVEVELVSVRATHLEDLCEPCGRG